MAQSSKSLGQIPELAVSGFLTDFRAMQREKSAPLGRLTAGEVVSTDAS